MYVYTKVSGYKDIVYFVREITRESAIILFCAIVGYVGRYRLYPNKYTFSSKIESKLGINLLKKWLVENFD